MKSDIQIQKDVMDELKWDPLLNSAEIGVSVKRGIVTLSGQVDSYAKKLAAEKDVLRVSGVKALAEDMKLGVFLVNQKSDSEIAEAVANALKWHSSVPENKIKIKVENGVVDLEGEVEWEYQRGSAKLAVQDLVGVKAVYNSIKIKPRISATDIHQKIESAFKRSATIDAGKIQVQVIGNKVVLGGKVKSYSEKEEAEHVACSAPGVIGVEDKIEIEVPEFAFEG